jgi:hypothetical protein
LASASRVKTSTAVPVIWASISLVCVDVMG